MNGHLRFIPFGVDSSVAIAAVVLYQAVNLLVPLAGGTVGYVSVRGDLRAEMPAQGVEVSTPGS